MPTIELKDVTVLFENKKQIVKAIDCLSNTFASNSFNVIVGYSGCGKTTLLRTIAGLKEYQGVILFDNSDIRNVETNKRNLAYVSQTYTLYPSMTVFDNIAFPLKMKKLSQIEIQQKVIDIAKKFELTHCLTRKPKQLSGGQQQRVAIARALVKDPSICLFDEPLSNLDAHIRVLERTLIKKALKEIECTVIYVTHDIVEAMALADNLVVMDEGKIVLSGNPLDVFNSNDPVVVSLKTGLQMPTYED